MPLVIFYNADLSVAQEWADEHPEVAGAVRAVVADRRGEVYRALGTKRTDPVRLIGRSLLAGAKSARHGILPTATKADMLRLRAGRGGHAAGGGRPPALAR